MVALRAMGVVSEAELVGLVGGGPEAARLLQHSIQEANSLGLHTEQAALWWLGAKIRAYRRPWQHPRPKVDEARDVLASVILSHIPVPNYNFWPKAVYMCLMIRKMLAAAKDPSLLDDKDYYGNKRLELAGQLLSLLFEDLFKRFNNELKHTADATLAKANRAMVFDARKYVRQDSITNGLTQVSPPSSLATSCPTEKIFPPPPT